MNRKLVLLVLLAAFFLVFLCYPLGMLLSRGVMLNGRPSLYAFQSLFGNPADVRLLVTSLFLATVVTGVTSLLAVPLALLMNRRSFPLRSVAQVLLLFPLVLPPFVGALGFRQLFGRFGTVNIVLMNLHLIREPIVFLGGGNIFGVVVMQVLHLVPILFLTVSASVIGLNKTLEEAAATLGATPRTVFRRISLPLLAPGYVAGASLVFVGSLTDLGTPLLMDFREVLPVRLYELMNDPNESGESYALILLLCGIAVSMFLATFRLVPENLFAATGRVSRSAAVQRLSGATGALTTLLVLTYCAVGVLPHLMVVATSFSAEWFLSPLPTRWTLSHYAELGVHPLTVRGVLNSLFLATVATILSLAIGYAVAMLRSRGPVPGARVLDLLSMTPVAVPGIIFAFGYAQGFARTVLDNRINPFPLLLIAYAVRRLPQMVRSADAGFRESSRALEEAAATLGASPAAVTRRITLPLMKNHLLAGAVLTFSYCMLEVSDSLILALEERFYPMSKAIYALVARPDGAELASALGTVAMMLLALCFWGSRRLLARREQVLGLLLFATSVCGAGAAQAQTGPDELVIVSPHWEGVKRELERSFSEKYRAESGRELRFRWLDVGGTSEILKFIRGGFRNTPESIGVDLLFGGGTDPYLDLKRDHLLWPMKLPAEVAEGLPRELGGQPLYDQEGEWFSAALTISGIFTSREIAARAGLPAVQAWRDLADPQLYNWVSSGDPRRSGSIHFVVEMILQGYGWDEGWRILTGMIANCPGLTSGSMEVGKNVSVGEAAFGPLVDNYASEIMRQVGGDRVQYILPKGVAVANGDGIAVLKGAPHREIAERFISFLLSDEGQTLWRASPGTPGGPLKYTLGKLPVRPAVYERVSTSGLVRENPFHWTFSFRYDAAKGGRRWRVVNELFGAFIAEVHRPLREVQAERLAHGGDDRLFAMPVSELEAERIVEAHSLEDPVARASLLNQWRKASWERFPEESWRIPWWMLAPLSVGALGLLVLSLRAR